MVANKKEVISNFERTSLCLLSLSLLQCEGGFIHCVNYNPNFVLTNAVISVAVGLTYTMGDCIVATSNTNV